MKIPFTNIELSPNKAIAAVATTIGTLWSAASVLFGSAPITATGALLTTAITNAITNAVAFAGYYGKEPATKLYNSASQRLGALASNSQSQHVEASAPTFLNAPRRSARLAAKNDQQEPTVRSRSRNRY